MSIQLALYAISTAVAVWWLGAQHVQPGAPLLLLSLLLGGVAALVAWRALSGPALSLGWDGSAWQLQRSGIDRQAGRVALMLDLGSWLLVRFVPDAAPARTRRRAAWLPLSRRDAPAAWPALRVALHAPPAPPAA